MSYGTASQFEVKIAHRFRVRWSTVPVFFSDAGHDVQPVIYTDGQQQDWNGVHGRVEGHLNACKLQPAGQSVGGADRQHGQDHHVRRVAHASEVEPEDDTEQNEGRGGQDANLCSKAGVGPFGELSEGEGPYDIAVLLDEVVLKPNNMLHDDRVHLVRGLNAPCCGLAVDDQRDEHRAIALPRGRAVLAGQAGQDEVTEIDALQA